LDTSALKEETATFFFERLDPFTQRRGLNSQKKGDLNCVLVLTE